MDLILVSAGIPTGMFIAFYLGAYSSKRERQKLKQESILKEAKEILK